MPKKEKCFKYYKKFHNVCMTWEHLTQCNLMSPKWRIKWQHEAQQQAQEVGAVKGSRK